MNGRDGGRVGLPLAGGTGSEGRRDVRWTRGDDDTQAGAVAYSPLGSHQDAEMTGGAEVFHTQWRWGGQILSSETH